ncbi:MAG TPA: GNAT family N-acetyltransferase [Candidatus Saccharimonadales bacterium]|nr:GNAT family N-acetyltransferase [Candidatus Saccharimonadales bacterium]
MAEWSITGTARLEGTDRSSVDRLRRACEAVEPLDLKIELDEAEHLDRPIHFLAVARGEVIGYAGVTAGDEAEVCGMVDPSYRGRGIGAALLNEVRAAARSLGRDHILVICEDAGPSALAWMRRIGAIVESAECRMVARLAATERAPVICDTPLEVRGASSADRIAVAALLGEERIDHPSERRLVGLERATVVGTLRLTETSNRTMIYGLVIDGRRRGQRLGTRMLAAVIKRLRDAGVAEVGLEVDPQNGPAVRLYERFGFETVTTYRYMRLAITPPERPGRDPVREHRGAVR